MAESVDVIDGIYSAMWEGQPEDLPIPWSVVLEQLEAERATPPWRN